MFIEGRSVETCNPLYSKRMAQWIKIRDFIDGSEKIKEKRTEYLPAAKGMSEQRYNAYLQRAVVVNYVSQTLSGIHGMVFRRQPELEYPKEFEDVIKNIDLKGTPFYKFASDSIYDSMQTGFGGYLVDIPPASPDMNEYEAEQKSIRVYASYYKAESVVNWKTRNINGIEKLALVVLKERVNIATDEFTYEYADRYRVLSLDEKNIYKQRIYVPELDEKTKKINGYNITEITVKAKGKELNFIPFIFAVSDIPEKPMLADITEVNIGHYMKTADYENGVHLTTIPTGWVTGEQAQVDSNKNIIPICLGEDNFLMFKNEKARVGVLNYAGEGLTHCESALAASELQMVVLGSRIITPEKGISETAESANIHRAGENAKLATFANNASVALMKLLDIMMFMKGIEGHCKVRLNTDYETQGFDANALNAMANIFSQGKMPLIVLYGMMMRGEFMEQDMTFKDYVTLLDLENSGLSPNEAYEAYKIYKETGVVPIKKRTVPKIELTNEDFEDKKKTDDLKTEDNKKEEPEDK